MSSPVTFTAPGGSAASVAGAGPKLVHAYLELREPPTDSTKPPGAVKGRIDFQFNPKDLTLNKSAKWKRDNQPDAAKSAVPQFTGADPCKLQVEMFLDATEKMDDAVVKTVEQLFGCCVPTKQSRQDQQPSPPLVIFRWGGLTGFPAILQSVSAKYTLFTPSGMPVRALCTVTLEEFAGEPGKQNPTSGALAASDTHTVVAGDSLASVAYRSYGDPALWRQVALANEIDDPMRLPPGTVLLLPALSEVTRGG